MRTFLQDLRFGFRMFRSSPGLTAVAVLTLALGIAANTTVFSWVDGILLRPFPGANQPDQLAVLEMVTPTAPNGANQISYPDYRDYRANLKSLAGLALHREGVFSLGDDPATAQAAWGELVSGNYFEVLGMQPALGRFFTASEDGEQLGAHAVAVISDGLWRRRFQANPLAVGTTLSVNQRELTIVGVAPAAFRGTMPGLAFDIWVPVTMGSELGMLGQSDLSNRGSHPLYALARLKPGIGITQARAEAATFARSLEAAYPLTNRGVGATILPVWETHNGAPELLLKPLRILMAISILVLLIVCANVANLLLVRSVARRKELSIRLALGAHGRRLSRQLFSETLLLAGAGTLVGLLGAFVMADSLPALVPQINAPIAIGFQLSGRVMGFTVLACVLAALLSGAAPALFWLRPDAGEALKEGGRSGKQSVHSQRLRNTLVVAEVALAAIALIGAALFLRSFQNARKIDPGFDRTNVVLARFYLEGAGFSPSETQQFCLRLRDRLASHAGISAVSYANYAPLGSGAGPYANVEVEGYVPALDEPRAVNYYAVAPGYFDTLRTPLLEGRDFRDSDDENTPPVVIVNESFARRYFAGTNPVGRSVRCFGKLATVIGLVKDSKYFNVAEPSRPHFFASFRQRNLGRQQLYVFARADSQPDAVMAGFRREVAAVDSRAAAFDVMPLIEWTEVTMLPQKVAANLLAALGLIALILAAVGLYSVMAYSVTQRTQEIGVRMALGAKPANVLADVLRRGLTLTAIGLAAGIVVALAGSRLVSSMLVNVSATDWGAFAGSAAFLTAIALLASYLPARRATKVDPMIALRSE